MAEAALTSTRNVACFDKALIGFRAGRGFQQLHGWSSSAFAFNSLRASARRNLQVLPFLHADPSTLDPATTDPTTGAHPLHAVATQPRCRSWLLRRSTNPAFFRVGNAFSPTAHGRVDNAVNLTSNPR
ncbi:hypothetical protein LDO31_07830 [Luteimonas sp. XNQY3]|nr:hypothetical protein [Luteimonas sp. XNQY3]MCD9006142.1 hypothetical protein [Luteimonas sp. XNQY3]